MNGPQTKQLPGQRITTSIHFLHRLFIRRHRWKRFRPISTDVTVAWSVCMVCLSSVTFVHPTKAVGRNEMPFGRDTRMVPSNTVLDRGPVSRGKGGFGGWSPQFTAMPLIAKLL